jgi:hypothetical protein
MFREGRYQNILLECAETKDWRTEMCKRCLDINEEVVEKENVKLYKQNYGKRYGKVFIQSSV